MTTEDIFLGSQASLTMIPEVDLFINIDHSASGTGFTNKVKLRTHGDFENLYLFSVVQ